jgi:hypothetical protein
MMESTTGTELAPQDIQATLPASTVAHFIGVALNVYASRGPEDALGDIPTNLTTEQINAIAHWPNVPEGRGHTRDAVTTLAHLSVERGDIGTARRSAEYLRTGIGGVVAWAQAWRIERSVAAATKQR